MNFFEQQERARRRTWLLAFLFSSAVAITVALTNFVVLIAAYLLYTLNVNADLSFAEWASRRPDIVTWTSVVVLVFIAGACLYRMFSLSAGGRAVAEAMGGELVDGNTDDPLRRQLVNVVEEMAIASGVPVPAVYVLQQESGINAFAAGFTAADAAVAVTRGTLEHLTREELQGVVAHEFSHIFNGDMRLNMRLLGVLYGIVVIGLTGRALLRGLSHARARNSGQAMMIALFAGLSPCVEKNLTLR